ncbi:MAG: DUF5329 family protein [Syntrophales bacterium]
MHTRESNMRIIPIWLMVLISLTAGAAYAQAPRETAKIDALIHAVETLEGAKFIRNGQEYGARAAADHLRLKLRTAGDRVKTADDFIRLCASQSSLSGKKYRIRFADGTTEDAETFFRKRLNAPATDKP